MKLVFVLLLLVVVCGINTSCVAGTGGGMDSGGVDHRSLFAGTAWFTGPQPVQYCYRLSSGFGASRAEVTAAMAQAIGKWTDYLKNRLDSSGMTFNPAFLPSLNFQFAGKCRGGEDLEILFGVNTAESDKAKSQYENPVAFTHETARNGNRGRGFIWLAPELSVDRPMRFPDWKLGNNLLGITMHEFGHVFGIKHYPGTIMRESFEHEMQENFLRTPELRQRAAAVLSSIDDTHFLIDRGFQLPPVDHSGRFGLDVTGYTGQDFFLRLTGRAAVGEPKLWVTESGGHDFTLHLADATESVSLPFEMQFSTMVEAKFILFVAQKSGDMTSQSGFLNHSAFVFNGKVHTPKGEDWDVSLDWNRVQQGPDSVLVIKKSNDSYPFFWADPISG